MTSSSELETPSAPSLSWQKIAAPAAASGIVAMIREGIVTSGPRQDPALVLGYGIGGALAVFLLAALFLVWLRRTRPLIPGAMWMLFAVQLLTLLRDPPTPQRLEVATELQRYRNTIAMVMDPDSSAASRLDIRMPDGRTAPVITTRASSSLGSSPEARTARALRAMTLLLEGWNQALRARAQRHGVDLDVLPDGYLGARYLAGAKARPDVQDYFRRYSAYLDDVLATAPAVLDSLAGVSSASAGLSPADAAHVAKGVRRGIDRFFGPGAPMVSAAREFITAAVRLHRFLVRVDSRVQYDRVNDQALFEVDAERFEAIRLIAEVQQKSEKLVKLQRQGYEQTKASAESLATR